MTDLYVYAKVASPRNIKILKIGDGYVIAANGDNIEAKISKVSIFFKSETQGRVTKAD